MTHQRQTIRDAVVTILDGASIVAAGSVYSNRVLPLWPERLPLLNVYARSESAEMIELNRRTMQRELTVTIEAAAKDTTAATIDDTLDALAESIEDAMDADITLSGTVLDSVLSETEFDADVEGAYPVGRVRLTYTVQYMTTPA